MTIQPEMKFHCDRCATEVYLSLNDQPAQARERPPEGWLALWLGNTLSPAAHICPSCRVGFDKFMSPRIP